MMATIVIGFIQISIVIAYLVLATLQPATAAHIAAVACFFASFAVSRYSLYRVKKSIRRKHGLNE